MQKRVTFLLISFFISNVFSQNIEGVNARLDAMASSAAADDIGWAIMHPASIFKFPNHFQGTICLMDIPGIGKTYGTVFIIVRFTEFLYMGVTHNNRTMLGGGFYDEGCHFLNAPHLDGA